MGVRMRSLVAATLLCLFVTGTAEAAPVCSDSFIDCASSGQTVDARPPAHKIKVRGGKTVHQPFGAVLAAPSTFIAGSLKCAVNVNAALAAQGVKGTDSALAKSFLNWGRSSPPVPGAVAVYDRGGIKGHVAIVKEVLPDGRVVLLNPGRHGWEEGVYNRKAIDYRVSSSKSASGSDVHSSL